MHGIVFASLHDFLREHGGADAVAGVFGNRVYSMADAHPDADFNQLLERACEYTGLQADDLSLQFGAFTGERTFPRLYPAFYELAPDTCSFLLNVENRIHELVRATIPNAQPPALTVRRSNGASVEIIYESPRQLCRLLEGLVVGTSSHYREQVRVEEIECSRQGAPACRFLVQTIA